MNKEFKGNDNEVDCINNDDCLCRVIKCINNSCTGPQWPTGPEGPTGATGPTGSQGETNSFDSYAMVHDETNSTVPSNNPILLQTTNISNKITYNPATGDFLIPEKGIYMVNWWFNVKSMIVIQKP